MARFIIYPKEETAITMTIRIDRSIQEGYDELANKTGHSRNALMGMALKFALDNMEIQEKGTPEKGTPEKGTDNQ